MRKISQGALVVFATFVSTTAIAESNLYGSIRQVLLYTDTDAPQSSSDIGVVDSSSRFGLKGNQEVGTATAFARWEWGVDANTQSSTPETRLGYVGLSGDFGSVSFGSQWSAWDTYVGGEHTNFAEEGVWHNGTKRNGDNLKYVGHFRGVTLELDALLVIQGKASTVEDTGAQNTPAQDSEVNEGVLDEFQFGVGYGFGPVTVELAMIARDGGENGYLGGGNLYGGRISYHSGGPLTLAFAIAFDDDDFGQDNNEETVGVKFRAEYEKGPNTFLAVVTQASNDDADTNPYGVAIGYQYNLSKRSRVSLEMSSVDPDIAGSGAMMEGGVMYRHDW